MMPTGDAGSEKVCCVEILGVEQACKPVFAPPIKQINSQEQI